MYGLIVSKVYLEWDQIIKPQNFCSKFMNLTNQILKNDVQILIFCLTYIITTAVHGNAPKIYVSTFIRQRRHLLEFRQTKGQLVSKGL